MLCLSFQVPIVTSAGFWLYQEPYLLVCIISLKLRLDKKGPPPSLEFHSLMNQTPNVNERNANQDLYPLFSVIIQPELKELIILQTF